MIVGERKASGFVLLLVIALLVGGLIAVVWFHRKETPTPMRKPPRHSASWLPDKPNQAMYVRRPLAVQLLEEGAEVGIGTDLHCPIRINAARIC
jgi:hypothetical protein